MTRPHKRWAGEREDTLRKLYGVISTKRLAELLDTTPVAVRLKATALGITRQQCVAQRVLSLLEEISILRREGHDHRNRRRA